MCSKPKRSLPRACCARRRRWAKSSSRSTPIPFSQKRSRHTSGSSTGLKKADGTNITSWRRWRLITNADALSYSFVRWPAHFRSEAVEAYFRLFYWTQKSRWDKHNVMEKMAFDYQRGRALLQFREVASAFQI